jgi:hypothetical protein
MPTVKGTERALRVIWSWSRRRGLEKLEKDQTTDINEAIRPGPNPHPPRPRTSSAGFASSNVVQERETLG